MSVKKKLTKLCIVCIIFSLFMCVPADYVNFGGLYTVEAAPKVKLNKTNTTIYVGKSTQLKVKGTKSKVKWSSSKKSVATVSSKGKVKGKKAGTTIITAKVGNKKYKCKVTVKNREIPIQSVTLNRTNLQLNVGEGAILNVTIQPSNTTENKQVIWESSNSKVATVDNKGYVKGNNEGRAVITATVGSKSAQCIVTVNNPNKIQYIGDRDVIYDSNAKEHRLFFSLMPADQTRRLASSGVANIKIVNDDNVEIYNKRVPFNENNFANWTNMFLGTRYLCCIKIPDSALLKSTSTTGKLIFNVTLSNGVYFNDYTCNIYDLPLKDLKEVCKVTFPSTPLNISYISNYSNQTICSANVTGMDYTVRKGSNGKYDITINISGTKTYDKEVCK